MTQTKAFFTSTWQDSDYCSILVREKSETRFPAASWNRYIFGLVTSLGSFMPFADTALCPIEPYECCFLPLDKSKLSLQNATPGLEEPLNLASMSFRSKFGHLGFHSEISEIHAKYWARNVTCPGRESWRSLWWFLFHGSYSAGYENMSFIQDILTSIQYLIRVWTQLQLWCVCSGEIIPSRALPKISKAVKSHLSWSLWSGWSSACR